MSRKPSSRGICCDPWELAARSHAVRWRSPPFRPRRCQPPTCSSVPISGSARRPILNSAPEAAADAQAVIDFWQGAGAARWFAKDAAFDHRFRETCLSLHERAARRELTTWGATAMSALALVLLLDQFPRNAFRGTPRTYATDDMAREVAAAALEAEHDRAVDPALQLFFYLPFGHSEDLAHQVRSVRLNRRLGRPTLSHAERHPDIIRRFGRFPHRNLILGRAMRQEEQLSRRRRICRLSSGGCQCLNFGRLGGTMSAFGT